MPTVAFRTLGCKLNACETAQMEQGVTVRGFTVVPWRETADFRVINTCTVTAKTDRECRHEIRRAKRRDPTSRVVVTGCFAQVSPGQVSLIDEADLILGNLEKPALAEHLQRLAAGPPHGGRSGARPTGGCAGGPRVVVTAYEPDTRFQGDFINHFSGYTRAFLKVQNGCDQRCAYCIIPVARGPSRSMPLEDVLEQVRVLAAAGFREIVLTGIHLGAWGRDTGEGDLAALLAALAQPAHQEPEALRFRVSSTEPMEVTDAVLGVMRAGGDIFADHFHVPLQSGSDAVLSRMGRPYRSTAYQERIESIRSHFPLAAIGADVIVGFPGETEEEFEETMRLVERLPLTYLHVFTYSDRPGTVASTLSPKISPEKTADRGRELRALGQRKKAEFHRALEGRVVRGLVLQQLADDGRLVALSGNYQEIALSGADGDCVNRFVHVRLRSVGNDGMWEGESV